MGESVLGSASGPSSLHWEHRSKAEASVWVSLAKSPVLSTQLGRKLRPRRHLRMKEDAPGILSM
jgi:hypothetical protein